MATKKPTTDEMSKRYAQTCERMHAAALAWKERHRELAWGSLEFRPLGVSEDMFVAAPLGPMIAKVGANAITRVLLDALEAASGREASVAQAEAVIEIVFGIRRALTVRPEDLRDGPTEKSEPETVRLEAHPCPDCGYRLDAATPVGGSRGPGAGDFTVCIACAAVLVFTPDLKLRVATLAETNDGPPDLMRAVKAVSEMGLGRGRGGDDGNTG